MDELSDGLVDSWMYVMIDVWIEGCKIEGNELDLRHGWLNWVGGMDRWMKDLLGGMD